MATAQKTKSKAKAKKKNTEFRNEVITDLKKIEDVVNRLVPRPTPHAARHTPEHPRDADADL